jgi:hypothetical protein
MTDFESFERKSRGTIVIFEGVFRINRVSPGFGKSMAGNGMKAFLVVPLEVRHIHRDEVAVVAFRQSLTSATAHRSSKSLIKVPGSGDFPITESLEPRSFKE